MIVSRHSIGDSSLRPAARCEGVLAASPAAEDGEAGVSGDVRREERPARKLESMARGVPVGDT